MYVCIYIYIYIHVCVYIYIYIHTPVLRAAALAVERLGESVSYFIM